MSTIAGRFCIQVKRQQRWTTHSHTRSLAFAQEIAQRLQHDGEKVRIRRTIVHR